MVLHAGIDLSEGEIRLSNSAKPIFFDKYGVIKVNALNVVYFDKIFDGFGKFYQTKIECICICLPEYLNEYKEMIVKCVARYRFKKVEVVDKILLKFCSAISQSTNVLKINDIIWVCSVFDLYVWQNNICQAKYNIRNSEEFTIFCTISISHPDVIMYQIHMWGCIEATAKHFPKCKFLKYEEDSVSEMALIYAKIMGGEITLFNGHPYPMIFVSDMQKIGLNKYPNNASIRNNYKEPTDIDLDQNSAKKQKLSSIAEESFVPKQESYTLPTKFLTNNAKIKAVGIDLGTSRCCVAVNRRNGIETVPLDNNGERLLPSFVAFDEVHDKCGQIVIDRLRYHANSSVFDSKRIIGKKLEDIEINSNWPFQLKSAMNKSFIEFQSFNGKTRKTPEQIAAVLLTHIKQKSEEYQEKELNNVVITVPASFTNDQKEATLLAATLAGWDSIYLLPEPTAAAFAYFIERPVSFKCNLIVVDLGGGTLDVCVCKIQNDKIQTIANSGNPQLGGRDFDNLLIDYFSKNLREGYGIEIVGAKKYKLMLECQKIKQYLSLRDREQLDVEDFDPAKTGVIRITRQTFEDLSKEILLKIKITIISALNASKHTPGQIEKVLQVGGGSRMPMVKLLLTEMFPEAEHCCEKHPEEVVAIGAAYYAYNIFSS